ncbi:MAG: hypothetical protein AAGF10_04775, partial [Verrucomicrobiota bacterium]
ADFKHEIPMDCIIRFEQLHEGFQQVAAKLELNDVELPHELASGQSNYVEDYDGETIEHVAKVYGREIDYFGYTFQ